MLNSVDWLLHRPIGRLADKVGEDAAARTERTLSDPHWRWIQEQVPTVVHKLDVAQRVEQKIMDFPTPQLEALVRGVSERELQLIIRLGYVLGAMIGLVSASIALLF